MGVVVDTSVFVSAERLRRSLDLSRWQQHGIAFVSAVTVSELLVGVHLANTESRRHERSRFVERVLSTNPVLDFTESVARVHAKVIAELRRQGTPVGLSDTMIAATALFHGAAVLTGNIRDFQQVSGLTVLEYVEPLESEAPSPSSSPEDGCEGT